MTPALRRTALAALILASVWPVAPVWGQDHKQVVVLYATRRASQISILGDQYLPRLLHQGLDGDFDLQSEYLELARSSDPGYQQLFAAFLRSKYANEKVDLVVTMQDAAYDFVVQNRGDLFAGVPIIFVASSPAPQRVPNSTGVSIPYEFTGTLKLALALQPSTRHVLVVSGADVRDREFERIARLQFQTLQQRLEFTYLAGLKTSVLEAIVAKPPADSIIYYLVVNRDGNGDAYHPLEYLDRLTAVAGAPVYSWTDSTLSHGIVGGNLKDQRAQTEAVGQLALRVLRGEAADAIPISAPNVQVSQVDWQQLKHWNIAEARVPADAQVLNREPTQWDRYRPYLVLATVLVLAQTALIAGLLIQGIRRRRAEEELRNNQGELRRSYQRSRDLCARLLHAQDNERARIARELHDDISQQLALLQMDLERLSQGANGSSALTASTLKLSRNIATSVHDLSHSLHPEKVRLIGLTAGLKGLQRDLSARSNLAISLVHDELPALSHDITLCLFRVTQEALQNAAKHSAAREISIELHHVNGAITLTVADDGVGFDVESAWEQGLGLISMAERIESIGGRLVVQSAPGQGARLETRVPLPEPSVLQSTG